MPKNDRSKRNGIASAVLAALSTLSICVYIQSETQNGEVLAGLINPPDGAGILYLILLILLAVFYRRALFGHTWREHICAGIPAFFFSLVMIIGRSYSACKSSYWAFGGQMQWMRTSVILLGLFFFFAAFIQAIFCWLSHSTVSDVENDHKMRVWERHPFFYAWALILLCWLPYLILCYPACIPKDALPQLAQAKGFAPVTGDYFLLQTLLLRISFTIGSGLGNDQLGIFLYAAGQLLLLSAVMAAVVSHMPRVHASAFFRILMLAFYALFPLFPVSAISLGNETLFGLVILLLLQQWFELARLRDAATPRLIVKMAALMLLLSLTGNAGICLALAQAPFLILSATKYRGGMGAALICVLAALIAYHGWLLPVLGIGRQEEARNLALPFQQTARYVSNHKEDVTRDEREAIDQVLTYSRLAEVYDPGTPEPVLATYRLDAGRAEFSGYLSAWFDQMKRHPNTYADALIMGGIGYIYPGLASSGAAFVPLGETQPEGLARMGLTQSPWEKDLGSLFATMQKLPGIGTLTAPGFYSWMIVLAIAYLIYVRRGRYIGALLPAVFVIVGCILSGEDGALRFMLPVVLSMPVIVSYLFCAGCEVQQAIRSEEDHGCDNQPSESVD